jgi:rod shape-determining protein MreC
MVVIILVGLRLIPEYDPIARFIQSNFNWTTDLPVEDYPNPIIADFQIQIDTLKTELDFKNKSKQTLVAAEIVNKTTASYRSALKLDKGGNDGLKSDQPVFVGGYLVGVIASVEPESSTVLLIGDPDVVIPVQIGSAQGVVRAQSGGIVIDEVAGKIPISGSPVITSGVGGLYKPGLVIGSVGAQLSSDIFYRFVLNQPINTSSIRFIQVGL